MNLQTQLSYKEDVKELTEKLRPYLLSTIGDRKLMANIEYMFEYKKTEDDVIKLLVRDMRSDPTAVVLLSTPEAPDMVDRGLNNANQAKQALGDNLGSTVISPLLQGVIDNRSFGILPYYKSISNWRPLGFLQRKILMPSILSWLRGVIEKTANRVEKKNVEKYFLTPLMYLAGLPNAGKEINNASRIALKRLESGHWNPYFVLMHDDFWIGNILLRKNIWRTAPYRHRQFIIIDWPGSLLNGYAIYDLVRMAISVGLRKKTFREEVRKHTETLKCNKEDAIGYLLAALGNTGLNLRNYPMDSYEHLIRRCFSYFQSSF